MASLQRDMEEQTNHKRSAVPLFRIGDKEWLNLRNVSTPQPPQKLAWKNTKYKIHNNKVVFPHVVELDVLSKIFPRFHVQLIKKSYQAPLPSQVKDNTQPPPDFPSSENLNQVVGEQFLEKILKAEKISRGRGWVHRVLVKCK